MHKTTAVAVAPIAVALAIAGCGGSSKSSGSSQPAAATGASSSSSSSGGGAYGQSTASGTTAVAPAALITTKQNKLGTILAYGPRRMTVYLFQADKGSSSTCTAACAAVWPPVIGKPQAKGRAVSADLGTITRADGKSQVTYKGHPLYLFAKDKDNGDAYGQGVNSFGADWYVLRPSGVKIDNS